MRKEHKNLIEEFERKMSYMRRKSEGDDNIKTKRKGECVGIQLAQVGRRDNQ